VLFSMVAVVIGSPLGGLQPELIDRTVAIVGGQAITLSDVRAALQLGLIERPASGDPIPPSTRRLIDRALVLREVQRYSPPEPPDAAVDARVATIVAAYNDIGAYRHALAAAGFDEDHLRAWMRDELRITAYLDQRFAAAGAPSEDDVAAEYARRREEYEKTGESFEAAAPSIRARLASERRAELVTDWIADLRRRTTVVELLKP
jgi:hypothetical protein